MRFFSIFYNMVLIVMRQEVKSIDSSVVVPGILLAQNDHVPYKWANDPFSIHIHAHFTISVGRIKF